MLVCSRPQVRVEYPDELLRMIEDAAPHRKNALYFSTLGGRSLADEIKGSDFDGDKICVIGWQKLVKLFIQPTPPYEAARVEEVIERKDAPPHFKKWLEKFNRQAETEKSNAKTAVNAKDLDSFTCEKRLLNNYIMARFMSCALVGTSAVQWMVAADKHGAASWQCHLVRTAQPH